LIGIECDTIGHGERLAAAGSGVKRFRGGWNKLGPRFSTRGEREVRCPLSEEEEEISD
jgi:hypothetical protein